MTEATLRARHKKLREYASALHKARELMKQQRNALSDVAKLLTETRALIARREEARTELVDMLRARIAELERVNDADWWKK